MENMDMTERNINQCSVVLTRNCNLRCNFCYVKDAGYCASEMVSFENLKKIVDFCCEAKVKYIFFTGGEPLLYPHLEKILKYIKQQKHQMATAVASNGVLLEDLEFCKRLRDSGLDYIDISMKGGDSQEWIDITGCDGYIKQQKGISNMSSIEMEFTCSMVITIDNVFSLCASVKTALDYGAKQFSFTFVIDNDNGNSHKENYLENHNPFQLIQAFISQIDFLNKITEDWWIEYSFPMCVYTEEQLELLKGKLATPCQIHKRNAVTFDTQLNLLPCDMYFETKIGQLGKDFNNIEEFENLQENEPYKGTLEGISKFPSEKCYECQYLDKCYGGCPVLWKNYSFHELIELKEKVYK